MAPFDPAAATATYLGQLPPAAHARAIAYTHGGHWLVLWTWLVSLAVCLVIIQSGMLARLRNRLDRGRPKLVLTSFVVSLVFLVSQWLLMLPWSVYAEWWRERSYGLNNQSWAAWLTEAAVAAGISAVIGAVFLLGLYMLMRGARRTWWAWTGGLAALFVIFMLLIQPIFIEPLFNRYRPAPDGPVRDAVIALAQRSGVPSDKVLVYDGSKQSNRYTANVAGLFGTARVAMSDAMFARNADLAEVRGVVGHEMGHYAHMHSLILAAVFSLLAIFLFWLTNEIYPYVLHWTGARDVAAIDDPAGLPIIVIILATLELLLTPGLNTLSRLAEADADRFSLEHAREPDGLAKALVKTIEYRAASPGRIEEIVFYDHPGVERRIRKAMEWKAAHPKG